MAHAYTPGLQVTQRTRYHARRVLPIPGEVLVQAGQRVDARDVVARTELPGDATPINLSNLLALPAGDVPAAMLKKEGKSVDDTIKLLQEELKGRYDPNRMVGTIRTAYNEAP